MSRLYGKTHRELQEIFETRKLADLVEENVVHKEISEAERSFIETRDMFFLSSVNDAGWPTVSYKGGDPGFVKVVDQRTLAFPSYDGNGMFLSMGNIGADPRIGLLFIDFEDPKRLRVQGEATISQDDPLADFYEEADLIVRVSVSDVIPNCPRYVHRYQKLDSSQFVPRADRATPLPDWKRIDTVQDVLRPRDRGKAAAHGGIITAEEYQGLEDDGD